MAQSSTPKAAQNRQNGGRETVNWFKSKILHKVHKTARNQTPRPECDTNYSHLIERMFERFTANARRVIFFARYEAGVVGSSYIEPQHLLLGVLRQDRAFGSRLVPEGALASIRKQIEEHLTVREKSATTVDIPLSRESKHVLAYAAEEAQPPGEKRIDVGHLLLGVLREENSFAAAVMTGHGISLATVRNNMQQFPDETHG